jgi:hypothetical protein
MRDPSKGAAALALASLAVFAAACNKGPAEEALKAADQALAAARPEIETYVPEELTPLTAAMQAARSQLEQGHYTEALRVAQGMPVRIQAALAAAAAKKEQLVAAWNEASAGLPSLVQSITARLAELAAAPRLPKGLDEATLAAAQTDLGSVAQVWGEAKAAYQGGDVPRAVRTARDVQAKAEALAALLGLTAAPPAAK